MKKQQLGLVAILSLPLIVALLSAPPFSSAPRAAGPNRMLGPNFPAIIDSNGDGVPGTADRTALPRASGGGITVASPFSCDPASATREFTFANSIGGVFTGVTQTRDGAVREAHAVSFTAPRASGRAGIAAAATPRPTGFSYSGPGESGTAGLIDSNGDGAFDGVRASGSNLGTPVSMTLPLAYVDVDSDGAVDYVSLPGSFAALPGVDLTEPCLSSGQLGANPQVWIPLGDSDGDGRPDTVVPDFDGNGQPDTNLPLGPPVSPVGVPTLPPFGLTVLAVLMMALTFWSIRRRRLAA